MLAKYGFHKPSIWNPLFHPGLRKYCLKRQREHAKNSPSSSIFLEQIKAWRRKHTEWIVVIYSRIHKSRNTVKLVSLYSSILLKMLKGFQFADTTYKSRNSVMSRNTSKLWIRSVHSFIHLFIWFLSCPISANTTLGSWHKPKNSQALNTPQ